MDYTLPLQEIFTKFESEIDSNIPTSFPTYKNHFLSKLTYSYNVYDNRYNDEIIFNKVVDYFENKLLIHKIHVFNSGIWLLRQPFFKDFDVNEEDYIYNLYCHDLSKFSAIEAIPYALHDFSKKEFTPEFTLAWCHHKSKNEHHPEFWLNPNRKGEINPLPMLDIFIMEMIADWIGAGKTYGDTLETWLPKNFKTFTFHPETEIKVKQIAKYLNIEL